MLNVPVPPALASNEKVRIAILFSGGLDCTVLARMVHDILPTEQQIDLINVAFENPRVVQAASKAAKSHQLCHSTIGVQVDADVLCDKGNEDALKDKSPFESCPDRMTGRKAFQELQNVCPSRVWRFVAVSL